MKEDKKRAPTFLGKQISVNESKKSVSSLVESVESGEISSSSSE